MKVPENFVVRFLVFTLGYAILVLGIDYLFTVVIGHRAFDPLTVSNVALPLLFGGLTAYQYRTKD